MAGMAGVRARPEHGGEMQAGAAADGALESLFDVSIALTRRNADRLPSVEFEIGDIDGIADRMLGHFPGGQVVAAAADIGGAVIDAGELDLFRQGCRRRQDNRLGPARQRQGGCASQLGCRRQGNTAYDPVYSVRRLDAAAVFSADRFLAGEDGP